MEPEIWVAIILQLGALAGIIIQGRTNARKTSAIAKQVYPNSGSSLADAVNRSEANSREAKESSAEALRLAEDAATRSRNIGRRIDNVSKDIGSINERLSAHLDGR